MVEFHTEWKQFAPDLEGLLDYIYKSSNELLENNLPRSRVFVWVNTHIYSLVDDEKQKSELRLMIESHPK